ncbi:MAG: hypothetical protein JKY56_22105 [Kofleriaceae bacterium]|nr:hypothetical protein [Kofleriaceae bacterium]
MPSSKTLALLLFPLLSLGCGASNYTSYTPAEIVIVSKEDTLNTAESSMEKRGLVVIEKNLGHGLVASKWELQGKRQYNVQELISPVGSIVRVGCRIQKRMDMQDCPSSTAVPVLLVQHAKAIAHDIEMAEEVQ